MYFDRNPNGDAKSPKLSSADESALKIWLRASNKAGLDVPWVYVRRLIARAWHVPPWMVDEAPTDEIFLELKLLEIENG